jgi:hypothetical protein
VERKEVTRRKNSNHMSLASNQIEIRLKSYMAVVIKYGQISSWEIEKHQD